MHTSSPTHPCAGDLQAGFDVTVDGVKAGLGRGRAGYWRKKPRASCALALRCMGDTAAARAKLGLQSLKAIATGVLHGRSARQINAADALMLRPRRTRWL